MISEHTTNFCKLRFMAIRGAEDLYCCMEGPYKGAIYARQRRNKFTVKWFHTDENGHENGKPLKAGLSVNVVDEKDCTLFLESMETDKEYGGTYARKEGPFSDEAFRILGHEIRFDKDLISFESWKRWMLVAKENSIQGQKIDDDSWLWCNNEILSTQIVRRGAALTGQRYIVTETEVRHRINGNCWKMYEIKATNNCTVFGLCGFKYTI